MKVDTIGLEFQLNEVTKPTVTGYLLNNQGRRIKCRVTTDDRDNIVFCPIEPIEESKIRNFANKVIDLLREDSDHITNNG